MSDTPTPSFSEFVKEHRAAARKPVHDEAESICNPAFDWLGEPVAGLADASMGALTHQRRQTAKLHQAAAARKAAAPRPADAPHDRKLPWLGRAGRGSHDDHRK